MTLSSFTSSPRSESKSSRVLKRRSEKGESATCTRRPHGAGNGRKEGTVRAAIDGVVHTYWAHKLSSPAHDSRGRLDPLLAAQLRGYALDDPEPSQRQALPAAVVEVVANMKTTKTHRAIGQLVVGAFFFFAMRSCECSEASGSRRTKTNADRRHCFSPRL